MSIDRRTDIKETATIRTAVATAAALKTLDGDYPYFVHKWTKQKRHYAHGDLSLPNTIFARGMWPNWDKPVIGIGGTRTPTVETFCLVAKVVRELAKLGTIVISGGVPGVDLAAHLAAIDEKNGTTVVVLANPVTQGLKGHEWHNGFVESQILQHGLFVSEYRQTRDVFSPEYCERFLARDRIVSGLCDVFVAFECNEDSATVDTAHRALVQGKRAVAIESMGKSARHGIDQLRVEYSVRVLSERHHTPKALAQSVLEESTASRVK